MAMRGTRDERRGGHAARSSGSRAGRGTRSAVLRAGIIASLTVTIAVGAGLVVAGCGGPTGTVEPPSSETASSTSVEESASPSSAASPPTAAGDAADTDAELYPIVDTGQSTTYDERSAVDPPSEGDDYYGQDAQYDGDQPSYTDNGDGTVTDEVTGLMWQKSYDTDGDGEAMAADKLTYPEALERVEQLNEEEFAGHDDWRLPTIKELYSLIDFSGTDPDPMGDGNASDVPFIDTAIFDFAYGDESAGERIIDVQYATSTLYTSTTMGGNETMFGVNFADGRIKGYPAGETPMGEKTFPVLCVRGNPGYGVNDFSDNGDGTVTDAATGLMWSQDDSGTGMDWKEALAWVQEKNAEDYLGHDDWRLPNAKELQSIVDYTRSPDATGSAAIDPVFACTQLINEARQKDWPGYWSSTTHVRSGGAGQSAVYVAFGRAMGYMNDTWTDVHGAGAQRSDPKAGDASQFETGRGPQGDAVRTDNYVRLVRDAD